MYSSGWVSFSAWEQQLDKGVQEPSSLPWQQQQQQLRVHELHAVLLASNACCSSHSCLRLHRGQRAVCCRKPFLLIIIVCMLVADAHDMCLLDCSGSSSTTSCMRRFE